MGKMRMNFETLRLTGLVVALGTLIMAPAAHAISVDIGSAQGVAGSTVSIDVSLAGASDTEQVVAIVTTIGFDAATPIAAGNDGKPDCSLNPSIMKDNTSYSYQPRNCTVGTDCTAVKAAVISLNPATAKTPIPNGVVITCRFAIPAGAATGTMFALTNVKSTVTDPDNVDTDVTEGSQSGQVEVVESTPTPTETNTPVPTDTPVPTNTLPPTLTPTITNTPVPTATSSAKDDDGCQIVSVHQGSTGWLLLFPAAALFWLRRRPR